MNGTSETKTTLKMNLKVTDKASKDISLADPKENLTASQINAFVDIIVQNEAILRGGLPVIGINKAYYYTVSTETIIPAA